MTVHVTARNLAEAKAEAFKPPVFRPERSTFDRVRSGLRRLVDLQFGSAWRDLRGELAGASGTVLDVGCGAQVYRPLLPPQVVYRGIDTRDAADRFGYKVPDTYYFEGDDWQVADASIDLVLCTEVLEHIEAPLPFLSKIGRCLRPGGKLLLTVPFAARWHFIPYDYWRYTPSSLRMLLVDAGFSDIRVTARGNPFTVACYKTMALPLMLLFRGSRSTVVRAAKFGFGTLLLPVVAVAALLGTISLRFDWGDDCLGYTVSASKT